MSRRLLTLLGVALAIVAFGYVVRTIADSWAEVEDAIGGATPGWLVAGLAAAVAAMTAIAWGWDRTLVALGVQLPLGQVVARYYVGEIGKYLPGTLWPLIGRGELAARAGARRSAAYTSVAVSLTALYVAAGLAVVAVLPMMAADGSDAPLWPLVAIPIGVALLMTGLLERIRLLAERISKRDLPVVFPSPRSSAVLVACYLPTWAFVGTGTWFVARALDPSAPFWPVVGAAVLSWLAGFVAVPVPGGVGVREAVFVAAVSGMTSGIAATVALVARLVFVLVDAAGWAIGSAYLARHGGRGDTRATEPDLERPT